MAGTLSNAFITQWASEVKFAFQQKKSLLRDHVRVVSGVNGSTFKFTKFGAVTANTKTGNAQLTYIDPQFSTAVATLEASYCPIPVLYVDLKQVQANADIRREYVEEGAMALNRSIDKMIVASADLSNTPTVVNNQDGKGLTFDKALESLEILNTNNVDPGETILVVGPKQISDALKLTQFDSRDYNNIMAVYNGEIKQALGFTWVRSNMLNTVAGTAVPADTYRNCYAITKSAIGLAIGQDIITKIDDIAQQALWLVNSYMLMGSTTIDPNGVIQIPCME